MFINIQPGNALNIQLPFGDGGLPKYPRPYLVIDSDEDFLYLLNVSSIRRKEWKLDIDSNKKIENQYPPFPLPSFVKMDYVYQVPNIDSLESYLMDNGATLHNDSLQDIVNSLNAYESKQVFQISEEQIFELNATH